MRLISYDCEVFAYDWLVTLKDKETGIYTCIWNDNEALKMALSDDCIYVGFNSKHYDQYIIKAIAAGLTPQEVKQVNDYIITGGQGWQCPQLADYYFRFNNVDIRDDTQKGLSLKAIEGHLGMSVKESSVPFDIDRPLTPEEKAETEFYCKHDVDTAERLIDIRKDYLKNKINLGRLAGLDEVKAMGMTNAKLTAAMLKATKKPHDDERKYVYPGNLRKEYIPPEVFAFFDRMYDFSIPDSELFKGKFNLNIGECPVTLGYGGVHGAIPNFFWEETEDRGIWNEDVGSYYPHLCTINGYTSRNIPSPQIYEDILERRMKAKAAGDKHTANALKLVCNITYGCLLNQYNDLYDPLMGRSVCISGQLYLLELAEHCYQEIKGLRIVQLNTDGIMVECDKKDYDTLTAICAEWQSRTGFDLEEDTVVKIAQKDVNNYVEVQPGGKAKAKGGYLVKGIAPAGAFNINNSCVIVATALKEFFVNGTPAEDTINGCDDIFQFQIIAKAGAKYKETYHVVDGVKEPVQKVNRVYATADERYGKIYKVKSEDDSTAKIEMLPEHCIIDNDNQLSISDVDKSFYIDMARKRVNDFMGIKPEKTNKTRRKKMATTTKTTKTDNVYQRLLMARSKFLDANVEKSGKNMHLSFKYFELEDIVPTAIRIFNEVGLISVVNFTPDVATMEIINTENPDESVSFVAPFNQIAPIVSNTGKQATNEMQALGSSITYMRRYLYMIALDICESDSIDANLGKGETASAPAAEKKAPATPEQRQEVKENLTAPADNASALQIKGLKAVLKKLKDADPSKEEMIANIAVQTKGFTEISKSDCETLIQKITAMLEGGQK
nr:MAG TPA: DNA polymerase [Caudoviricetes sp.]